MEETFTLPAADVRHVALQDAVQRPAVPEQDKHQVGFCSAAAPPSGQWVTNYLDSNTRTTGSRRWLRAAIWWSESSV